MIWLVLKSTSLFYCQKIKSARKDKYMAKNNKPYEIEYVKEQFEKKDYTLISEEYKNKNTKLDYICNKHNYYIRDRYGLSREH